VIRLRWAELAYQDLQNISDYLFENSPENAEKLVFTIHEAASALLVFPNRGRMGKKPGTCEFVIPSLPYILVYKVEPVIDPGIVHIVRILHGAQDRST